MKEPDIEEDDIEYATLYLCPECKSKYSDIKGQPCLHCQEEANNDEKGCQAYTEWKEGEL